MGLYRETDVLVIGVTGGVGAGKSRILKILEEEYGAFLLSADQVAAELEEPGQEGYRLLVEQFGTGILGKDKNLDRKAFAEMIFKDPEVLGKVNDIIHPLTWQALRERLDAFRASVRENAPEGRHPVLAAVEAALFDENSRQICDTLWYIDASRENRIKRLMESRGYTLEKCRDIMKNQKQREEYLALTDVVIDNNETMESVREQIAGGLILLR